MSLLLNPIGHFKNHVVVVVFVVVLLLSHLWLSMF